MKTNVDNNSSHEEAQLKSKSKQSKKNEKPNSHISKEEKSDEKKSNENIDKNNNVENNNNNQIILDKSCENNKDNKENKDNKDNKINEDKNNVNENINININIKDIDEDPLVVYMQSNRKISEEEIKNSSKLIIEEIDGNLFGGNIIEINAGGMIGGRNKNDGFTIFGNKISSTNSNAKNDKKNDIGKDNNDIFMPDFELNDLNNAKYLVYPYIFTIYYKKEDKSYYIRAYSGKGSDNKILFIKLYNEKKYVLKQKELISAGNLIFQVTPIENNCLEIINLSNKKSTINKQIFPGSNQKIVTIGRHRDCDFFFPKDKSFSRYQTTFEFDENKKEWSVIDGKGNKSSTNGTWIFGTHSFLIKNEMFAEILNSKIKIREVKNENIENK